MISLLNYIIVLYCSDHVFYPGFVFRWFNCSGEARQELKLNEESIIFAGEEIFLESQSSINSNILLKKHDCKDYVQLFGYNFDKGSALLCNIDTLFKFAR